MGMIYASERRGDFIAAIGTIQNAAPQAAFPARNITEWWRPYVQARSVGAPVSGTTYFGVDHGFAPTIVAVAISNVSVSSIKIQAHSSDSWGSPTRDSGALTVAQDPLTGRYNYFYRPSGWTSGTRFLRAVANTTSVVDGSGVFALGSIVAFSAITETSIPLADPIEPNPIDASLEGLTMGGRDDTIRVGEDRAEIAIGQSLFSSDHDAEILSLLRRDGRSGALLWHINDGLPAQTYFMRRASRAAFAWTGPNSRRVDSILLRELI